MSWTFRKMSRGEMNADPIEGEFFTPEGLADALIRESVQNSLDARVGSGPVRVRFFLSGLGRALPEERAKNYLAALWPHLQAVEGGRASLPSAGSAMPFLAIEDFGTRGLCGSTEQENDVAPAGGSQHKDFFY